MQKIRCNKWNPSFEGAEWLLNGRILQRLRIYYKTTGRKETRVQQLAVSRVRNIRWKYLLIRRKWFRTSEHTRSNVVICNKTVEHVNIFNYLGQMRYQNRDILQQISIHCVWYYKQNAKKHTKKINENSMETWQFPFYSMTIKRIFAKRSRI